MIDFKPEPIDEFKSRKTAYGAAIAALDEFFKHLDPDDPETVQQIHELMAALSPRRRAKRP